jgi:hypothetical protein
VVTEICATNIPGIYIAGDLKTKFAKQIVVAACQGRTAALAAAAHIDQKKNEMGIFDTRSRMTKSDRAETPMRPGAPDRVPRIGVRDRLGGLCPEFVHS